MKRALTARLETGIPMFQLAFSERTLVDKVGEWSIMPDGSGLYAEPEQEFAEIMSIASDTVSSSSSESDSRPGTGSSRAESRVFKPRAPAALPMMDETHEEEEPVSGVNVDSTATDAKSNEPLPLSQLAPKELIQLMKQAPIKPRQVVPTNED